MLQWCTVSRNVIAKKNTEKNSEKIVFFISVISLMTGGTPCCVNHLDFEA